MSRFSFEYSQPEAYRFCQDSILAPREIARDLQRSPLALSLSGDAARLRALDVCAGCGVMGFELMHALRDSLDSHDTKGSRVFKQPDFDFLDVQPAFAPHFQRNVEITGFNGTWIEANFSTLESAEFASRYDLIISNPPYFLKGEGSLSSVEVNNRARFFLDAGPSNLLRGIRNALKIGGRAYLLMKSGKKHGRDAFTSARIELFDCSVTRLADVRGTDLVKITRD